MMIDEFHKAEVSATTSNALRNVYGLTASTSAIATTSPA